jgi:hypothetical protein
MVMLVLLVMRLVFMPNFLINSDSQVLMSIIAICVAMLIISINKTLMFKKQHKKVPEKIDLDNLHDAVIKLLDYCTNTHETHREFWSPEEVEYKAKKIKEELEYARELIDNPPPGPKPDAQYIKAIKDEKNAIYATWTTDPAMWRDPMFIYYITIMGIKNMIECQNQNSGKTAKFSGDRTEIKKFFDEGIDILNKITKGGDISRFFVLRFLILPRNDYTTHKEHIKSLLRIHHHFRMHCIPLVEERLDDCLSPKNKTFIGKFNNNVLNGGSPGGSYLDYLLVGGTIWWYKGLEDAEHDDDHSSDALSIIKMLAECYEGAKLSIYDDEMIKEITIFSENVIKNE